MHPETILRQTIDGTTRLITLHRPESANALNKQTALELIQALEEADQDSSVRTVILTGSGKRSFCAGADLKERDGMSEAAWHDQHQALRGARDQLLAMQKPVLAAVNGAAIGGGFELALACDLIFAVGHARFSLPEATLGIMPGMGGTQLLARAVGPRRAKELMWLAHAMDAKEACALGIVSQLCEPESLIEQAVSFALMIAERAPRSVMAIKRAIDEGLNQPLPDALATELRYYHQLLGTRDRLEGIAAFNQKRRAHFSGE